MKVSFIERRDADTASIEGVFRQVAADLNAKGVECEFRKLPFGNGFLGTILNFLFYRRSDADIHHVTGHCHYMAMALPKEHCVLTIHDLGILKNRQGLRKFLIKKMYFDWPVAAAGAVTVISEATCDALTKESGIEPDQVRVIDNPVNSELAATEKREFDSERPRILQVGTAPHKNLDRVVTALKGINCVLVVVGPLNEHQLQRLRSSGIEFEHLAALDDNEMKEQYIRADMVVFCSTFEGFGLPIIEAQATRTPVITSNIEPMRSVAGAGSMLADPNDAESIRRSVMKVIGDRELRVKLVAAGTENVKRFDGALIAERYLETYRNLLGS